MLKIYYNINCSKSRSLVSILEEKNLEFEKVDYLLSGLTAQEIENIIDLLGCNPLDIVRIAEVEFNDYLQQVGKVEKELTRLDIIDLLIKHPNCLQRPIALNRDKAIIARPPQLVEEILEQKI